MSQAQHSLARTTHLIRKEIGVADGSKHLITRARSGDGKSVRGSLDNAEKHSDGSFPSGYALIAFIAMFPFAEECDALWLHGVATLGSAGRAGDRNTGCPIRLPAVFAPMLSAVGGGNFSAKSSSSRLTINSDSNELSASC